MTGPLAAVAAYVGARPLIAPQAGQGAAALTPQPGALPSTGDRFLAALEAVDASAGAALTGKGSTQALVQTVAEAELALETVVAIRDKVVEAYQEIMRMPV